MKAMRKRYFGKRKEEKELLERLREIRRQEREEKEAMKLKNASGVNKESESEESLSWDNSSEYFNFSDDHIDEVDENNEMETESIHTDEIEQDGFSYEMNSENEEGLIGDEEDLFKQSELSNERDISFDSEDLEFTFETEDLELTFDDNDDLELKGQSENEIDFNTIESELESEILASNTTDTELLFHDDEQHVEVESSSSSYDGLIEIESESSESVSDEVFLESINDYDDQMEEIEENHESEEEITVMPESEEIEVIVESEEVDVIAESEEIDVIVESEESMEDPVLQENPTGILFKDVPYDPNGNSSSSSSSSEYVEYDLAVNEKELEVFEESEQLEQSESFEDYTTVLYESSDESDISFEEIEFVASISEDVEELLESFSEDKEQTPSESHNITQKNRGGNEMSDFENNNQELEYESHDGLNTDFEVCEAVKKVEKTVKLKDQIRILKTKVKIEDVCPNSNVAVAVLLIDEAGKTIGVRGGEFYVSGEDGYNDCDNCTELKVKFTFLVPEKNLCDVRKLKIKVITHYTELPK
jgi:hypothetical protein